MVRPTSWALVPSGPGASVSEIIGRRGLAVAAGLVVDRLVGEPSAPLHPVVWFGRVMRRVEG